MKGQLNLFPKMPLHKRRPTGFGMGIEGKRAFIKAALGGLEFRQRIREYRRERTKTTEQMELFDQ